MWLDVNGVLFIRENSVRTINKDSKEIELTSGELVEFETIEPCTLFDVIEDMKGEK